ncbi:MAG: phosphatase PAP2 family protein [Planctomycetes bacterium]|nr:phosphatase PAP2 family protein [Planctomycetota bacterium]
MLTLVRRHPRLSRVLFLLGIFPLYLLVNHASNAVPAHSLSTPLDRAIPFVPLWEYAYAFVYFFVFLPLAVVRDTRLFLRILRAYGWVFVASCCCFALFPVRMERPEVEERSFIEWGIALNYYLDPPNNCFPSLHLSIAFLGAFGARRANPRLAWLALGAASAIGASTLFVKQHYVADVLAGIVLAGLADRFLVRGDGKPAEAEVAPAYPAWVTLVLPGAYALFLALMSLAYRAGWRPWA